MQKNYETNGLGKKIATLGTIGLLSLVSVFNLGCDSGPFYNRNAYANSIMAKREEKLKNAPVINRHYENEVLYFSMEGFNGRYAADLKTLNGYFYDNSENKWVLNDEITKIVKMKEIFKDPVQISQTNEGNQDSETMKGMKERVGAAASFEGIMLLRK